MHLWSSGKAGLCKSLGIGSIPIRCSNFKMHKMDISQEFDLIKKMLDIAKEEKLENEVVHSFYVALRESNADIEQCIEYALSEWDLI